MLIDIGEVARRSGLTTATLRYYEAQGLISSCARHGLRRQLLQQLAMIALGRTAGFSLAEIRQMFGDDGALEVDRQALASKADALDRSIRRLTTLREGLRHAAQCPAPRHMDCLKFQQILRAASRPAPKRA